MAKPLKQGVSIYNWHTGFFAYVYFSLHSCIVIDKFCKSLKCVNYSNSLRLIIS